MAVEVPVAVEAVMTSISRGRLRPSRCRLSDVETSHGAGELLLRHVGSLTDLMGHLELLLRRRVTAEASTTNALESSSSNSFRSLSTK